MGTSLWPPCPRESVTQASLTSSASSGDALATHRGSTARCRPSSGALLHNRKFLEPFKQRRPKKQTTIDDKHLFPTIATLESALPASAATARPARCRTFLPSPNVAGSSSSVLEHRPLGLTRYQAARPLRHRLLIEDSLVELDAPIGHNALCGAES